MAKHRRCLLDTFHRSTSPMRFLLDTTNIFKMGQRQNRKRVRHRPNRQRKYINLPPQPIQPNPFATNPTALSIRYSYAQNSTFSKPNLSRMPSSNSGSISAPSKSSAASRSSQEDAKSRDIRIFGGVENEPDSTDLRGPMLDVVLGLFNGIDYDDALC